MSERKIGNFEVLGMIGRGGMGEVYQARDPRLDRLVALKILPAELAQDPERLARFEREARVLASLQHQNIAAIFGLEQAEGRTVLIMELAEGQDLSERMEAAPLPTPEVEKIARQLARGLEYAHEQGIVHRDLKPANVKVAGDGRVKILDFGLARAFTPETGRDSDAFQATVTQGLTGIGTVLGTAAYMSPEQARGYEVDRRSDIWAFGVILFEMMAGHRLFEGQTATDTLAAVLRQDPDFSLIPEEMPALLVQICRRCLEKDPQQRLRDIGEARVALEGATTSALGLTTGQLPILGNAVPRGRSSPLPWILVACLVPLLLGVGFLGLTGVIGPRPEALPVVHSTIQLPAGIQLNVNPASPGPIQVSPDGRHLAFSAVDTSNHAVIMVRDLDRNAVRTIPGTQGGAYQFWSADSKSLAFFHEDGHLKKVEIGGGPVIGICQADNGKGGSWHADGNILFSPSHVSSIQFVSAEGGEPRQVTDLVGQESIRSHRFPQWLPDGKHFLYTAVNRSGNPALSECVARLGSIDGSLDRELFPCQSSVTFADGFVLYLHDGILMSRPFSQTELDFTGPARPLAEGVLAVMPAHVGLFSASAQGVLGFTTGDVGMMGQSQLHVLETAGFPGEVLGVSATVLGFAIDPGGDRIVLAQADEQAGTYDLWIYEVDRDLLTRATFGSESEFFPLWSPDGQWLVYAADTAGTNSIYRKRVSGAGQVERLTVTATDCVPTGFSHDGSLLCFTEADSSGDLGLSILEFDGEFPRRVFRDTEFWEYRGVFSPDGKWLAYISRESGTAEVFVESLEPERGRWRVSPDGGELVRWSADGATIYYLTDVGEIQAIPVAEKDGGLRFGPVRAVTRDVARSVAPTFDLHPATGQIVAQKSNRLAQFSQIEIITGWQGLLSEGR